MFCNGFSNGMMGFMGGNWLVSVLIILAIGYLVWELIQYVRKGGSQRRNFDSDSSSAMRILEGRYANGEIDASEFEEKRRILRDK